MQPPSLNTAQMMPLAGELKISIGDNILLRCAAESGNTSDTFDYIERFYNRRKMRKLEQTDQTALN